MVMLSSGWGDGLPFLRRVTWNAARSRSTCSQRRSTASLTRRACLNIIKIRVSFRWPYLGLFLASLRILSISFCGRYSRVLGSLFFCWVDSLPKTVIEYFL